MRYFAQLLFAASFLAAPSLTGFVRADIVDDLTAHYEFDGAGQTVTDSFGGLNGQLGSAAGADANDPARIGGFIGGGALDFTPGPTATVDMVNLASSTSYGGAANQARTVSGWINVDAFGTGIRDQGRLFVLHGGGATTRYSGAVGSSADAGASGQLNIAFNDGAFTEIDSGGAAFDSGQWHHFTYAYDGTDTNIFLDGQFYASVNHTYTALGGQPASLGAFSTSGATADGFDGQLDDMGFWTRALTQSEIAAIAAFGDAGFVGVGNNLDLQDAEIQDVLDLTAGQSTTAAGLEWEFTTDFIAPADSGLTLAAGLHYVGTDGTLNVILGGTPGNFFGVQTPAPVTLTPEPSTFILFAMMLSALTWHFWRRRSVFVG